MAFSIGGLGSGFDTAALVDSLMQAERIPQNRIAQRQQAAQRAVTAWTDLRTRTQSLQSAAEALQTPAKALGSVAASSDPTSLKATTTSTAPPGQYSLKVTQLAVAQQQTASGLGPLSMTVGAGRSSVTAGPLALDLSGAAAGVHTVEVTRASAPAAAYGNAVLTSKPTDLTIDLGAGPVALTLASSTHTTAEALAQDVNDRLAEQGLGSTVKAAVVGGRLQIATTSEGSTQSLQLSGGAATALGLPNARVVGQAARVTVGGTAHEVDPEPVGTTATRSELLEGSGISLAVGTSLRTGSTTANVLVTTDTTTLGELQEMLNATGSPVSASLVAQGDSNTLVLSSTRTGSAGAAEVQPGAGATVLSGLSTTTASQDAQLTVNGIAITSSSNKVDTAVPGVTFDLLAKPADTEPRTVTVARDSAGTGDKVKALVEAMNSLITKVATDTKYDVRTGNGGPLVGEGTARSLSSTLFSKAGTAVGSGDLRSLAQLGIETTREGRFVFKPEVLTKALAGDPDGVAKVLSGFADSIATYAKDAASTGGLLSSRRDGAQAEVDARQKQFDQMETRLAAIQRRYKAQYAGLETAMASLNSQRSTLSAALGSFTNPN